MLGDTYMPTANILAFNDEKYNSQADGFATAKHGLQFSGLHHVSPQRARQALNTKFCYWRPMKKRGLLELEPTSDHKY